MEKFIGGCVVLHEQKCRVIARERADKGLYVHAVERGARGGGQSGKGLDDDDVLCLGIGRYTFTENLFQAFIIAGKFIRSRRGIAIFPARRERFGQVQLLDVTRQCRLSTRNAVLRPVRP